MSFIKNINKRKCFINITAILTAISLFIYVFAFSFPHDLHCAKDSTVLTKLLETIEKSHHEDISKNSNGKDNSQQKHNQDNCPICNLSYFNSLYVSEGFSNNLTLQETNERPVAKITTGFSSFSYFKFFLRSPPYFTA